MDQKLSEKPRFVAFGFRSPKEKSEHPHKLSPEQKQWLEAQPYYEMKQLEKQALSSNHGRPYSKRSKDFQRLVKGVEYFSRFEPGSVLSEGNNVTKNTENTEGRSKSSLANGSKLDNRSNIFSDANSLPQIKPVAPRSKQPAQQASRRSIFQEIFR